MLGKLVKYDLKYGMRIFIVLHAILVTACILGRILFMNQLDFNLKLEAYLSPLILFFSLFLLLFTGVGFGINILLVARFYKNLYTDEGYLTWTLPATATQQLWGKIISGIIWEFSSILISAASLLILVSGDNVTEAYAQVAADVTKSLGMPITQFGISLLIYSLFGTLGSIVMLYLCVAIGQLFPGHRILCAIVTYFILSAIIQVLSFSLMFAFNIGPGTTAYLASRGMPATHYMVTSFRLGGVMSAIIMIAAYFGVQYIMNKKLNLS
ncbi:hypothetical protein [Faecalicatena orotica]|uniref:hypothetical protein n=1 Tax=Faecalicatena orotica TaxID=1544 RepID=UPI003217F6A1